MTQYRFVLTVRDVELPDLADILHVIEGELYRGVRAGTMMDLLGQKLDGSWVLHEHEEEDLVGGKGEPAPVEEK